MWHRSEEWLPSRSLTRADRVSNMSAIFETHLRVSLTMPQFDGFPFPRRHNSLRLLSYDYHSVYQLCAISLVTELRRPLFADIILAKAVLTSLMRDETLDCM